MSMQSKKDSRANVDEHTKDESLEPYRDDPQGTYLTTDHGIRIPSTDDSLKAGTRGPTVMEDFHFREKITHFDHERIPERVVHARGSGAHGYFQVYAPMAGYTKARFLNDPSLRTPVFVRFSTVVGSRGSADTVRDVRGFATKFYTPEGNFDLVGNNIPVFFIQDGIKFPDIVHALKPEPHTEMPQASSAHDNFWDFASLVPESTHMLLWILSDRAIPRSYRMMEGFGVNSLRLVNAQGKARFVKFHWKPLLGVHSLVWDEAQKLAGKDPDFHRRDLWNAIERGDYPEYELGVQIIDEEDEWSFSFDLLDATKLVPEELVPVQRVGKLTLNRNPDNFFAETEQVAFHLGNVVPGIDFTNDPLLQARLFSYTDTQITRLGGPNFPEIPINRPVVPVHNYQQEGFMRQRILQSPVNYHPNSRLGGCPMMAPEAMGGFMHHAERVEGHKVRERSPSFQDHYSQAIFFWNSQSDTEKRHIIRAARFELSRVESPEIRRRVVERLNQVDSELARQVALGIGVPAPAGAQPAATNAAPGAVTGWGRALDHSEALSMASTVKNTIMSRRVAILAWEGFRGEELAEVQAALTARGAQTSVVGRALGTIQSAEGDPLDVDKSRISTSSVMFDAVFIPGGTASIEAMLSDEAMVSFVQEAFKHCKAIGATSEGVDLLLSADLKGVTLAAPAAQGQLVAHHGVVTARRPSDLAAFSEELIQAIAQHRHWEREVT